MVTLNFKKMLKYNPLVCPERGEQEILVSITDINILILI